MEIVKKILDRQNRFKF